tara:strand:+ start:546 stop:722 length:177 start_codon:yes stop_codon:yes gene_type:complete
MSFEDYNRSPEKRVFQKTLMKKQILKDSHEEVDLIKSLSRFGAVHVKTGKRTKRRRDT